MTQSATKTKFLSGNEIRKMFLRFFEEKGHRRVRSSSLVPHGDPTLLFTNAGMNQFKDVFLGLEKRDYSRACSAQKCVRAGGKHNDLENVGFTKRHHTFFEMLGNFSFGDYFKKEAIAYAWELVTSPQWFGIDKEKLYVTVFGGADFGSTGLPDPACAGPENVGAQHAAPQSPATASVGARHAVPVSGASTTLGIDDEAQKFWLEQNVAPDRIVPIPGLKDNFWAMGDSGPCGPCSEIFYDMGPNASEEVHTDCKFPCDCGRYVEIWNLVFMQFNRDVSGTLTPLPKPCVDTGMGLERVAAVLQGVISNYDTDLFTPLLEAAAKLCHKKLDVELVVEQMSEGAASLRVIADHGRATAFLITDGVLPSNEGRGYVLRKIMRRAIYHGRRLGQLDPFLYHMVSKVQGMMSDAYPELAGFSRLKDIVFAEEKRFGNTLAVGQSRLDSDLVVQRGYRHEYEKRKMELLALQDSGTAFDQKAAEEEVERARQRMTYRGEKAFRLYDTYGMPRDFIEDICRDAGIPVDWAGFEQAMQEQRTRARASWKGTHKEAANPAFAKLAEAFRTEPDFYFSTTTKDCKVEAVITKNGLVTELKSGEAGEVVLDRTVIYAESGGQVSDTGFFYDASESQQLAEVTGAYYPVAGLIAHKVTAKETLRVGDRVTVVADAGRRAHIMRNHSGTHLVHAALRNILGTHVKQSGSLNAPDRLRFDFSHFAHVDPEELRDIEQQVNEEIRLNTEIETNVTSLEEALASGALAFFGDKYPESNVRVVTIPDPRAPRGFYSKELCGGTHVHRIGDIGVLKIVSEESVAAGVRRIEAVTGTGAVEHYQKQAEAMKQIAAQLNVGEDAVLAQVEKLSQTVKQLEKQLGEQKRKGALNQVDDLAARAKTIKGVKTVVARVENVDREGLRQLVDRLRQKLGSGVVVLGLPEDGKVALIAGVTKDLTAKVHAGKLIQALAQKVGGKGGGRPDLAEGGGDDTSALHSTLEGVTALLEPLL